MPITFRCAACAKILRVPDTMAGKKGKCPKCDAILQVPTESEDESQAQPAPARRSPRPSPAAIVDKKALPPHRRIDKANDDEFADAPEEDTSRPRKKRKTKQRGMSTGLLVGLVAGAFGLLLLCSGVGGLAWWYFSSSSASEDLVYMPNNCQFIVSMRNDQMMQSAATQEIKRAFPDVEKNLKADMGRELGISNDDIDRAIFGIGSTPKDVLIVLRTKGPFEVKEIASKIPNGNYTEAKVGKYRVHDAQNADLPSICMLEKNRFLVGLRNVVHEVLLRDKKPDFSKNMQEAMKCVDFSKSIALAADVQTLRSQPSLTQNMNLLGGQKNLFDGLTKINAVALQVQVGADIRYDFTLLCQDATSASDLKKVVDGFLTLGRNSPLAPKEVKDMLELNLKVDANKLTGFNTIKVGPLIKLSKQMQMKQ